jgi:hypothetical protein
MYWQAYPEGKTRYQPLTDNQGYIGKNEIKHNETAEEIEQ